jgi:hypothetical protein
MTDDIVTRLQEHANGDFEKTSEFMLGLAADEIERLRADRDRWRSIAERAMELLEDATRILAKIQEGLKHD